MPAPSRKLPATVALVWGDDDFAVRQRSREIYQGWCDELGGMDHEVIDAAAGNSAEALKAIARLRESLQTLPFFGSGKAIWFQSCNFLFDERTASARAVSEALGVVAAELKEFDWKNVRLVVSALKVDKRKVLFKALERIGTVEHHPALSLDDRDWFERAEALALKYLRGAGRNLSEEGLAQFVTSVGPNSRMMEAEIEKLTLFAGERKDLTIADVTAIVTRNKQARAFALSDALGDRDLPRMLRCLDEELWSMKFDGQKSEIGLLYGLISKVRVLLFLKESVRAGWLRPEADFNRFKAQLDRIPSGILPEDKRFNPLAMNPFVLFKALPQIGSYSTAELVRAMDLLFQCNHQFFSRIDKPLALQRTLIQIAGSGSPATPGSPSAGKTGESSPRRGALTARRPASYSAGGKT